MSIRDTSICLLVLASVWWASPTGAEEPKHSAETDAIEEIIVTATRREAELGTLPLSVHVLSDEQLRQMGARSFEGYAAAVPGLNFTDFGVGGESHTIRGVTTMQGSEINPATSIYFDDVPITHAGGNGLPYSPDPMLVDIERIEILKGPQGTLFGASSMGGAIRIIPASPDGFERDAFVELQASTLTDGGTGFELHGMLNEPVAGGDGAVRAVGYVRSADGFIDNVLLGANDVNSDETLGGRLAASYRLTDLLSVTGKITYQARESDGTDADDMRVPARQQYRYEPEPNSDTWALYNLVFNAEFGWGEFVSSSAYLDRTLDTRLDTTEFLAMFFDTGTTMTAINKESVTEFTQEFRAFSPVDERFHWLAGVFFQDQSAGFSQQFPSPGFDEATDGLASLFGPADILYTGSADIALEQLAFFGEVGYRMTDNLELVLGARWFDIDRSYDAAATGFFNGGPSAADGVAGEDGVIPRFAVTYMPADGLTFYASAAKGFRPGGVNPPEASDLPECTAELAQLGYDAFPIAYDADSLWSYELGARTMSADGNLRLSGAVYHIDWSGMQSYALLQCGVGFVENAGAVKSNGIELALSAKTADRLSIDVGASYVNAKLDEDVPNFAATKGARVPAVPRFAMSLGVNVELPPVAGFEDRLRIDYRYVGRSYSDFSEAWRQPLPSYEVTNLRYSVLGDRWSATLFAENLFDERGIVLTTESILGSWETTIPPRRIGFSLRRGF